MFLRATFVSALAVLGVAVVTLHGANVSRQQADSLARKITLITQQGSASQQRTVKGRSVETSSSMRTPVSEGELNSWFTFRAPAYLPPGVTQPTVTLLANGSVKGGAVVDLDAVARQRSGTFSPWSYLSGRVPISVTGTLSTRDGQGRFEMQEAEVGGISVPRALFEELVSYYARTPDNPTGIRLGQAFDLPANIQRIEVGAGQMVVVQ